MKGMFALVSLAFYFAISQVFCTFFWKLNDGYDMPVLAFAIDKSIRNVDTVKQIIIQAMNAGFRHIDTSPGNENEEIVAKVISDIINRGIVSRYELFITAKLPKNKYHRKDVIPALRKTLKRFNLEYVDLLLLNAPFVIDDSSKNNNVNIVKLWKGMELAKDWGLAMSIGVSNFNQSWILNILDSCRIPPAVNQIEIPSSPAETLLLSINQHQSMRVMVRNPLSLMTVLKVDDPTLKQLSDKHKASPVQILLRFLIDLHLIPVLNIKDERSYQFCVYKNVHDFRLEKKDIFKLANFDDEKSKDYETPEYN